MSETDWKECFSLHLGVFNDRFVEIIDSTDQDYLRAYNSQFPEKREDRKSELERGGILKLTGVPLIFIEADIKAMFSGFQLKAEGIKRSIISGKPSGEAFVLLETEEEAQRALKLNNEKWAVKPWTLRQASAAEYEQFMSHNFINSGPSARERLPGLPYEKRKSSLLGTGFPMDYTEEELKEFFKDYKVTEDGLILLNNNAQKFNGSVIITFENEEEVSKALLSKNLAYVRNCYVELFEYK